MMNCAYIRPPSLIVLVEEAPPELANLLTTEFPGGEFIPIPDRKYWRKLNRWADDIQCREVDFTWEDVPGSGAG